MWDTVIAGATGLVGLYVALRQEVRRSHELLSQRIDHVEDRLGGRIDHIDTSMVEVRADIRRLDQKVDDVRGELISFLGPRQA